MSPTALKAREPTSTDPAFIRNFSIIASTMGNRLRPTGCCRSPAWSTTGFNWQTKKVTILTEAQTWAAIGVLAAAFLGTITFVTTLLGRTITAQIEGLRNEMNARFDTVDVRFDAVNGRIDNLGRGMQAITHKVFGKEY